MGRIKKVATEKHTATASPFISNFVKTASEIPLPELKSKLDSFPQQWPFPRGDLYHWIALLDRFDHLLELFSSQYSLSNGPQQEAFDCRLLKQGDGISTTTSNVSDEEVSRHGFSREGDRELVESILDFSRILLEHCGNRSLYASSTYLNDILNTTSPSLLRICLRLSLRLAQRYQVARYKNTHPHAQAILLQNHYSFNFDRLQKIAQPFPRPSAPAVAASKGKERSAQTSVNPSDLMVMAKEPKNIPSKADFRDVHLTYYEQLAASTSRPGSSHQTTESSPNTPTPVRRSSALGPFRDRPSIGERSSTASEVIQTPMKPKDAAPAPSSAPKALHIQAAQISNTPDWALVKNALLEVPTEYHYDVLNRIRIAKAFSLETEETSLQTAVEIRLLAVANLAYSLGESKFQERIGQADHEEPKRYHLAQQLCDLLQPSTNGQSALPLHIETSILLTIEALSRIRHKVTEVSDCLQIAQSHGILYYELRRVIESLNEEDHGDQNRELRETEWREAAFDLTNAQLAANIPNRQPAGDRMVAAGVMSILADALNSRTPRAQRFYEKVLQFFDTFIHNIPAAIQTLANIKGFDTVADLTSYEVNKALETVKNGNGLSEDLKSKVVDYDIPFHQQATLRQLFKFIAHMFEHNAGTHDRLLRNLIDTPQILGALRNVIENASLFGSNVWSGAVNIMSSFIHNEPTSFQVVGEAGLVKSLLQTVVPWELKDTDDFNFGVGEVPTQLEHSDGDLVYPIPEGILPVGETMCDIPTAFGAICLNENGMKMFQSSKALLKYMDIFVSPPHVRALEEESNTAPMIGQAFDELSRHHPQLKEQIMHAVIVMVQRVGQVCKHLAESKGMGAKLWERTATGIAVAGGSRALAGESSTSEEPPLYPETMDQLDKDRVSGVPFISACFKFLDGFFHNQSMCSYFCEEGGAIYLLDLATSASNPHDLVAFPVFSKITQVLKAMCEAKPHLVLPSLIDRTQTAIASLKPLMSNSDPQGAFATFTDLSKPQISSLPGGTNGTIVVKSLAVLHMLTHILGRALAPPQHSSPRHPPVPLFSSLNFVDIYIELVDRLSELHATCLWENLALQKNFSKERKEQTDPRPFIVRRVDANGVVELAAEIRGENQSSSTANANGTNNEETEAPEEMYALKNAKALRYLLSQTPMGIEAFMHSLGQTLTPKRHADSSTKQLSFLVADHIAKALVWQIEYQKFGSTDDLLHAKYTGHIATACSRILLRNSHSMESWGAKEALTLVLNKFYIADGFGKLNQCLDHFSEVLGQHPDKEDVTGTTASDVLTTILSFYSQVAKAKSIVEASQSRDLGNNQSSTADYFSSAQMVVEIRDAVLPAVSKIWHSSVPLDDKANHQAKTVIDILRTILKAEGEDNALKRSRKATRRSYARAPDFSYSQTRGASTFVQVAHHGEQLAREALYRCNYSGPHAQDYCALRERCERAPSFPIPNGEPSSASEDHEQPTTNDNVRTSPEQTQSLERQESVEMADATMAAQPSDGVTEQDADVSQHSEDGDPMLDDELLGVDILPDDQGMADLLRPVNAPNMLEQLDRLVGGPGLRTERSPPLAPTSAPSPAKDVDTGIAFTTLEDLDEKRNELRADLIDRCLEVLSAQPNVSFDLADLIQAAVTKTSDGYNRAEIGTTLVLSLLSLQGKESSPESGAKISAYAHLLALILQDRDFFDSTLDELKEYFDALVSWIQIGQDQKAEDMPWIEMILLIIERVLAEDEQPADVTWKAPSAERPLELLPEPKPTELNVSAESRSALFDTLVDVLPKIGKKSSLALSVCRVLVILTRRRDVALRLSEKSSMSRMFLMIRQLAGEVDEKVRIAFMIILRHMVEDEAILRQIMRTEIKTNFENHRPGRPMDTTTYTRNLYHLILRDPDLFAQVTQEVVEVVRYEGNPNRPQYVALKTDPVSTEPTSESGNPSETEDGEPSAQKSIEGETTDVAKAPEAKPPTVEITDGVVQFLLRELSNYRDVDDKSPVPAKELPQAKTNGTSEDVEMADASASASTPSAANGAPTESTTKTEKPTFKPEEHTIYVYRCFILQCLAELLASYNRTKVEFINFSRKPESQPATPSKPRAGTLNYLLNGLIPVGTLEHRDDIAHRKKLSTSAWATAVVVSLCSRTPECATPRELNRGDESEEQSDLTFVRKFVLEHALRAFKEATNSTEQLDLRYSRLLALADLFNKVLSAKTDKANIAGMGAAGSARIGQLMYERNFIPALTSAIAELDLNFPNAKRTVKYLLGPLKNLTDLGVWLSQHSELSSSAAGTTDEDEISSATSLSDEDDDEREQTPDLYRNSTLGMFDASTNHDEDSESTSEEDEDDEDMYDDGYDEEMDYEGEAMPDHGDVVSDEDEDIEGDDEMGPIEGIPGDVAMDVDIVVDEDEEDSEDEDGVSYDEDDDDEEHEDEDVDFGDHMDEITGDDENASIPDHDEGEGWEDDDDDLDHDEIIADGGSPHGGPLDQLARVVAGEDDFDVMDPDDPDNVVTIGVENPDEDYFDEDMQPEDDEDEDEEVDYENEVAYEPEIEEDDDEGHEPQWDWGAPPHPPAAVRGHHHHHRHGFHDMLSIMRGEPFSASGVRSHRSTNARGDNDGSNPLLQRDGGSGSNSRDRSMVDTAFPQLGRRTFLPRHGDQIIQELFNNVAGGPQAINVNIDGRLGGALAHQMAPMLAIGDRHGHAFIDIDPSRPWREQIGLPRLADLVSGHRGQDYRTPNADDAQAAEFRTIATVNRWQEEARMLFGNKYHEKAMRILNTLFRLLVPAAMEAKKQRDKAEAERKAAEEKAREEEKKRLEAKKAEREARETKEREEREAREAEEARLRAEAEAESQRAANDASNEDGSTMEGVEASDQADTSASIAAEGSQQPENPPAERITTTIRGREIDITNLGIDLSYLEALPEEIREEVIMGQFAEQRSQAAQTGEQPNEISRDFLDALPPEIQRELLRSEAMDRRRREQQEARRRAAEEGNAQPAQAEDMNNADFMAMLDPNLRQAILMDADENVLATLPEDIQAEARTLLGGRRLPRFGQGSADRSGRFDNDEAQRNQSYLNRADHLQREAERQRRPVALMLDKAGIATLLRLMFVSLHHKAKNNLHSILSDVCKNTQNRAEVISVLLSILQDGTADVNAVERSFAALSLRAKQSSGPKTPQPLKRTATGTVITPGAELSPLNIVQQCLATLYALSSDNNRVPSFFLTEHETVIGQKSKASKKGKGVDNKAAKFPLNALLTLLDRKLITENPGVMETLAALLSRVTRPLQNLYRRANEEKADDSIPVDETTETRTGEGSAPDVQMGEAATTTTTTVAEPSQPTDSAAELSLAAQADAQTNGQEPEPNGEKADTKKKHRNLTAPDVPEENICLVANIFTARECSSKTMQDTLEIIKHLSYIPGAQETFGKELVRQAHLLSEDVLSDLQELREQIDAAESDTSLQGVALAKFSSATSKQQKFLRTVTALDHLCDPEQMPGQSASSESSSQAKIKEGILATLYENPTFDKLWDNLSLCLTAIRKKGNMINVATILLPLIESLMVVCRNSTLKEPTVDPSSPVAVSTPPPAAHLETLFFKFTEDHRKILNELIRTNSKLMNGKFAVLAKNSKVLEFDNKRSYFNRKVHTRPTHGGRLSHPSLALSVRRDQVFLDSFKSLYYKTGEEVKYGKLNIRFHGEEGIDAGGVSREWFAAMARQMFNPDYALFNPVASDRTTFHPNPLSEINGDHLTFFKFIGRIIAKALYEGRVLDCHFSRAVYRRILGKSVSLKDMESLDLDYYKSLVWILENDITDITFETFSVDVDRFGATETVDLIPDGQNIAVTEENKQEYVRLVVEHRLVKSVEAQLEHFLTGFYEIIPAELISIFNEQELELLISGLPDIDIDDWKNNTEYHNYQATSPQIQWFWRAVRSFDKEEKAKLLQFVTGTSKVPLNGFKELEGMNGFAKFNIHRDYSSKEKLPSSHTCFNQLDLPEYESYEHLRQQLYTAITAGSEYFGFA